MEAFVHLNRAVTVIVECGGACTMESGRPVSAAHGTKLERKCHQSESSIAKKQFRVLNNALPS
jgi:hypothetical protein